MPQKSIPIQQRMIEYVDRSAGPDGCWSWMHGCDRDGYGVVSIKNRQHRVHRIAWELANGKPSGDLYVCHHCDNRACCNPTHLFLGTNADNQADKMRKARQGHRLTGADVVAIRERYAAGGVLQRELAKEYGVARSLISYVISRKSWTNV